MGIVLVAFLAARISPVTFGYEDHINLWFTSSAANAEPDRACLPTLYSIKMFCFRCNRRPAVPGESPAFGQSQVLSAVWSDSRSVQRFRSAEPRRMYLQ